MAFFTTLRTDIPVLPTDDEDDDDDDVEDDDYSTEEENSAMVSGVLLWSPGDDLIELERT